MGKVVVNGANTDSDLWFLVDGQGHSGSHKVIVPRDMLDDEVGDSSTLDQRKAWVEENIEEVMRAYRARTDGGFLNARFNRITVEAV
jgi:hypothetical protein